MRFKEAVTNRKQVRACARRQSVANEGEASVAVGSRVYGALIAYGPNHADIFRRSAAVVDRILKGEKPGDIPVQRSHSSK